MKRAKFIAVMMIAGTLACLPMVAVAQGAALQAEAAQTVLTVIVKRPGGETLSEYDRAELEALRSVVFRTSTIWTEGVVEFRGVPLSEIVRLAGVTEGSVMLNAANDYVTDIPVQEIEPDAPIVAYLMNGKPMSLRDKGPLWVVYPYDQSAAYQSEVVFTRSVWQLTKIEIMP